MPPPDVGEVAAPKGRRIAVAGNPNSGKTAVFNALTGLRYRVGNYPGVTVEKREGVLPRSDITLVDLPGTYALSARSPDEEITRDVLLGRIAGSRRPEGLLIVVDAANLERNLFLASQLLDFGMPAVIACNMVDVAAERGVHVDVERLAEALGVPVIATVATTGEGIATLRQTLIAMDGRRPPPRVWRLPDVFEASVQRVARVMAESGATPAYAALGGALLWITDYLSGEPAARRSAERYLTRLSAEHGAELREAAVLVDAAQQDPAAAVIEARYAWISGVAQAVVREGSSRGAPSGRETPTDRIDRVLTHRVFGLAIFAAVMMLLFLAIFSGAEPLMGLIEAGQEALADRVGPMVSAGALRSLVTDGVITGVGAVLVFFPQICILFLCLAILEDSGYMARAAFLMDRLMSRFGLHGRSFIPLLSSYACAIPGIMATRTIENRRDRYTTILIAPLMSCSARLPVYLTVIGALFGERLGWKVASMFGLYALGTGVALLLATLFKKTLFAGPRPTFIMELPPYHLPRPWPIVRAMWDRSKAFLTKAGTIIFTASIVVWALSYFPEPQPVSTPAGELQASPDVPHVGPTERLHDSYLARMGKALEPVLEPLGYDWRIGTALLSSFIAREVFVSTLGITLAVDGQEEGATSLREGLAAAVWPDGRPLITPAVGVGLLVFYVFGCQCISTLAVARRETRSWRWPMFMFAYMTCLAYLGALVVYQVGSRLPLGGS